MLQDNKTNFKNFDSLELSTPTLVIAKNKFIANKYDQLDIEAGEILIVTDWDYEDEWVYGHRKNNEKEKGKFPKALVEICNEKNEESKTSTKEAISANYKVRFERKVAELRSQNSMRMREDEHTQILINRNNLFNDAYQEIMRRLPDDMKNRLSIEYEGEEGVDCGGLLRDFFYNISKEIGNPNYFLFQYSSDNSYELVINPKSGVIEPNHLVYFKFIGRIMGLAIFHKQYLSINFSLTFYKRLLEKPLAFPDLKYIDPEVYRNLMWLKENEGVEELFLTFACDTEDSFGNKENIELKPNGANIDVTDSNKDEYIDLIVKYKLNNTNDKEQFNAIKEGFYEIIPRNLDSFDEVDLKYLLVGMNEIDVDDWENNTVYDGYNKTDITIVNFWKCVKEFENENRIKLLIFATGNSQVPVTGFKDLQGSDGIMLFKLKKLGDLNDLPVSHTCFNRIDLPPYDSYTILKQRLLRAIAEGIGSFEIS